MIQTLVIDPMPSDFNPPITDDGRVLKWEGSLPGADGKYEFGLRPTRNAGDVAKAHDDLRQHVWRLHEWARLGQTELIAHAHVKRHAKA